MLVDTVYGGARFLTGPEFTRVDVLAVHHGRIVALGDDARALPARRRIALGGAGSPTGLLSEQAQLLLRPLVYPIPVDRVTRAIERANHELLAQGVTSVQEAGIGGGWIGRTPIELGAYQNARAEHVLNLRVTLMVAADAMHVVEAAEEDETRFGLDLGLRTGFGDDHLRIGAMKIFADGSLVGR